MESGYTNRTPNNRPRFSIEDLDAVVDLARRCPPEDPLGANEPATNDPAGSEEPTAAWLLRAWAPTMGRWARLGVPSSIVAADGRHLCGSPLTVAIQQLKQSVLLSGSE